MSEVSPKPKVRETLEPGIYRNLKTGAFEAGWRDPKTKKFQLSTLYNDQRNKIGRCENITQARRARRRLVGEVDSLERVGANDKTYGAMAALHFEAQRKRVLDNVIGSDTNTDREAYYRLHLEPTLGHLRVRDITAQTIEDLYDMLLEEKGLSRSMRRKVHQLNAKILKRAIKEGAIGVTPLNRVDDEKIPKGDGASEFKVLTHEECQRLIAEVAEEYRTVVTLLAYTGLRVGEATELRWKDIDLTEDPPRIRPRRQLRRGTIRHNLKTKAGAREIPMLPFLRAELLLTLEAEVLAGRGGPEDLVCVNAFEVAFDYKRILREVKRAVKAIGITEHFVTHTLRHTFLSQCARAGMDVVYVSQVAGHSSPAITLGIYSHFFDEGKVHKVAQERLLASGFGAAV